ncbi:anaerobic ribonucleoside triphosphate reductase activating protein [Campylobacter geochelonis]|nr:anaerobic ribonucleoside triphosphate reductase activating protein [Campylobacter geochelonis]
MRCLYCYNTNIVNSEGNISKDEFKEFLKSRVGKLDGVVFSGGECTLSKEFLELAKMVKELGFLLKVDTNGSNLNVLKDAIGLNLVDFIALDFKALKENYLFITNSNLYDKFIKTLKYLIKIDFKFEVRTTVHADILDENDVKKMANLLQNLGYKGTYCIQNFLSTGDNFGCLQKPIKDFDYNKINADIKIELRNF